MWVRAGLDIPTPICHAPLIYVHFRLIIYLTLLCLNIIIFMVAKNIMFFSCYA